MNKYSSFFFALLITFLLASACSSDNKPTNPLLSPASYIYDGDARRVELTLHDLDGIEDILQADVMIQRKDGSGPLFEVHDSPLEEKSDDLFFDWTDGFGNQGTATITALDDTQQTVRLHLNVDHIENNRNMMFIDDYVLQKQTPTTTLKEEK